MKSKYYIVIMLVVALIGLAVFTYWYDKTRRSAAGNVASSTSSPVVQPLITTALPVRRTFTLRVPWIGTVETRASVELTALVSGRVEVINAEDQRQLEKGQRVMRLGGPHIEEASAKIEAEIKSLATQVDLARQTVERLQESLKTRLATKDEVAAAQEAEVRLEAQWREARLSLKTLNNQILITAPMSGIFTNRQVSVGQDVSSGQIVGEIIDTGRLRVAASLFLPQDIDIRDKEATIRLNENNKLTGIVQQVLPRASSTGAATVWIEGPQIDAQLRPGQMVEGDIVLMTRPDALAVPESSIVYDSQEHPFLFVSKDSGYEPLSIQAGLQQDGWVEVVSGLKQDQLVVTQGAYELFYRSFNEQFKVQD
jgi:membrane fusion protein (multidrug efflux system)